MEIRIIVPKWIDSDTSEHLYKHVCSLCKLLGNDALKVEKM